MRRSELKHLRDEDLHRRLAEAFRRDNLTTAEVLALLAEVARRQLHLRAGYDSMKAYCIGEFHLSEDAARKRVHAAHIASNFPALIDAIADGRLHMTAVRMLGVHLTPANVDDL